MKKLATLLIDIYKITVSPILFSLFGKSCRHEVACSSYTKNKINEIGFSKGVVLGFKRFSSCHPYSKVYTNEVK